MYMNCIHSSIFCDIYVYLFQLIIIKYTLKCIENISIAININRIAIQFKSFNDCWIFSIKLYYSHKFSLLLT